MRLIDADAINFHCFYEGGCSARVSKADCMGCKEYVCDATDIKNMPTAYDLEAVVAEIDEILEEFYQMKPHDQENPYNEGMQKGYKCALEIVRKGGKHLKGCVNCKHQSEQRTACEWYKSQGLFLRECPEWVRKE